MFTGKIIIRCVHSLQGIVFLISFYLLSSQCLEKCPPNYARNLFLLYAKMEEEHGLARHAMQVYSRATKAVPPEEKLSIYNIYLQHAQQIYGVTKTREIYQVC